MGFVGMHNDFTLFSRKVPSGKTVVYYYAYNDDGERLGPWSTGQATKTAGRNYCNGLIKSGMLVPGIKGMTTFAVYAADFWDWGKSEYLRDRVKHRNLTVGYADKSKWVVESVLLPYFGKMRLDRITGEEIDRWMDHMIAEKYEFSTINTYYSTIQTMMKWAAKKRYVVRDPFLDVEKLHNDLKDIKIITQDEFDALFIDDWETVWDGDLLRCTANKLAALTSMRCGEVLGLRGEFVFDDHIFNGGQYGKYGYRETKTKVRHHVPLAGEMVEELRKLMEGHGDGYVFTLDGGETPVTGKHVYNGFVKALNKIGIGKAERKKRKLTFHAWRHFGNTEMLKGGLTIEQVQAITGHTTKRSTDRYTHFNPLEFGDAVKVQAALLKGKPKKQEGAWNERPTLTIYKPEKTEAANQDKAS
jgi:integrase